MAYIQDSTQPFTITALLEGSGIIEYMYIFNLTKNIEDYWNLVGGWSGTVSAEVGDLIDVTVAVINRGVASDTIWCEFTSPAITPENPLREKELSVDFGEGWTWTFIMPAENVDITFNAGHVE